jgi:hypothetical protein
MLISQCNAAMLSHALLAEEVMTTDQNSCLFLPQAKTLLPCSKKTAIRTRKGYDGNGNNDDDADAGGGGGGSIIGGGC